MDTPSTAFPSGEPSLEPINPLLLLSMASDDDLGEEDLEDEEEWDDDDDDDDDDELADDDDEELEDDWQEDDIELEARFLGKVRSSGGKELPRRPPDSRSGTPKPKVPGTPGVPPARGKTTLRKPDVRKRPKTELDIDKDDDDGLD